MENLVNIKEELHNDQLDKIEQFLTDIYALRKESLAKDGEYGIGNLVFKELRNKGYLDKLKDLKNEVIGKELSLESLTEKSLTEGAADKAQANRKIVTDFLAKHNLPDEAILGLEVFGQMSDGDLEDTSRYNIDFDWYAADQDLHNQYPNAETYSKEIETEWNKVRNDLHFDICDDDTSIGSFIKSILPEKIYGNVWNTIESYFSEHSYEDEDDYYDDEDFDEYENEDFDESLTESEIIDYNVNKPFAVSYVKDFAYHRDGYFSGNNTKILTFSSAKEALDDFIEKAEDNMSFDWTQTYAELSLGYLNSGRYFDGENYSFFIEIYSKEAITNNDANGIDKNGYYKRYNINALDDYEAYVQLMVEEAKKGYATWAENKNCNESLNESEQKIAFDRVYTFAVEALEDGKVVDTDILNVACCSGEEAREILDEKIGANNYRIKDTLYFGNLVNYLLNHDKRSIYNLEDVERHYGDLNEALTEGVISTERDYGDEFGYVIRATWLAGDDFTYFNLDTFNKNDCDPIDTECWDTKLSAHCLMSEEEADEILDALRDSWNMMAQYDNRDKIDFDKTFEVKKVYQEVTYGIDESLNEELVNKNITIDELKKLVDNIYNKINMSEKPDEYDVGGKYYGSTELLSHHGNMLEIVTKHRTSGSYYNPSIEYNNCYAVKVGGAYKLDLYRDELKELKNVFDFRVQSGWSCYNQIITKEGYVVRLVDEYGTNFCVYGFDIIKKSLNDGMANRSNKSAHLVEDKEFFEMFSPKDRNEYRIKITRIANGNQPVIQDSGIFQIYNVKQSDYQRIVRMLEQQDFIENVYASAGRFDFSKPPMLPGQLPDKYYTIIGKIIAK